MKRTLLSLLWLALTPQAHALPDASVEDILNVLTPVPKTRSLTRSLKVEPASIDLTINFDFDSAKIKDESKPQLDSLVKALQSERLATLRFQVEGHTDAQGTATYNDALSARRAASVVSFLTQAGVDSERLRFRGKGFRELLEPSDPKSATNRRVRIITLE
jgi:outer membrane protein OmpA-like peptidoglycan-associated protein